MSPDTELRSSHAGRLSATPTVREPEAERRSTEPLVAETAISPEPELAWRLAPLRDFTTTSPEPDFAVMGQFTSPTDTSPEPDLSRAPLPSTSSNRNVARSSAAIKISSVADSDVAGTADDLGVTDVGADRDVSRSCLDHVGQPVRYPEAQLGLRMLQRNWCGKLIRSQS